MGVSKAASTWIHRCLSEHPGVFVPASDSLRFFDLDYHEGLASYEASFASARPGQVRLDASPTYLRSPVAAARIAHHYPDASFVISLRNPIERAFSQYWHEKKQGRFDYDFEQAIGHFLFFPWIVEHGFYATHLERLLQHFPRESVTIVWYDELVTDPRRFLDRVLAALRLPAGFNPSMLQRRVNEAGALQTTSLRAVKDLRKQGWLQPLRRTVRRLTGGRGLYKGLAQRVSQRDEYDKGMSPSAQQRLIAIYREDIERLQQLTGQDLTHWLTVSSRLSQ